MLIIMSTSTCRRSGRSGGGKMYKEIALSFASFFRSVPFLLFPLPKYLSGVSSPSSSYGGQVMISTEAVAHL